MADVGVPEGTGARRLPAKPRLLAAALAHWHAVEPLLDVEPAHGGRRDGVLGEAAVGHQGAQDERDRGRAVLPPDVEKELALLGSELLAVAAIAARGRPQGGQAALAEGVVPALQRGDREALGGVGAG